MVPPVRWYMLLSTWIFILSVLYPMIKISTFPLNLLASVGCLEVILNPYNEHALKNIYILFIHIAPFFWIPYELSTNTIEFAAIVIIAYFVFMMVLRDNPIDVYMALLREKHTSLHAFTCDRFSLDCNK